MNRLESFVSQFPDLSDKAGFEIWFAVIIDYNSGKAIWIRYTTFSPRTGTDFKAAMFMWATFYDSLEPENHCFAAKRFEYQKFQLINNEYIFPDGSLSSDKLTGKLETAKGELSWDLNLSHKFEPLKYAPKLLENLGIAKTKAIITSPFAKIDGEIKLNNQNFKINNGSGILTHIWGTTYIEDLIWIYVPQFDNDLDGWSLEIVSARPKPFMPQFTFALLVQKDKLSNSSIIEALSSSVDINYPQVEFKIKLKGYKLKIKCKLNLEQTTRYIYKDPGGSNRYIAHSDVGEVICQVEKINFKKILICKNMSAVEFHSTKAWDNEAYLDPLVTN